MSTRSPVLSLITGKVGRDASFQRLVDSIVAHTDVSWELVVSDASPEPYRPSLPNIRVLHENPRLTCVQGYNNAFRAARGEFCLWLNDDAEVCPNYAVEAVRFMQAHPQIGLGALHYSEDGGPYHVNSSWKILYANFGIVARFLGDRVDWFDTDLTMYGNDNSLAFRILMAGWGIADIPGAKVIHHSAKDQTRIDNQVHRQRDNDILTRKYIPLSHEWQSTYNRFRMESSIPWVHGVSPELVQR